MNWDIRKGEKFPTVVRNMFEMREGDRRIFSVRDLKEKIWEDIDPQYISPGSFNSLLRNLEETGYVRMVNPGGRGRGNSATYQITEMGWEWWELHGPEGDWGYGVEWQGYEDGTVPDSKLWNALMSGKQVRIKMPCDRRLWKDIMEIFRSGQSEIVLRLKDE